MITCLIKNTGQSPARRVRYTAEISHQVGDSYRKSEPLAEFPVFESDISAGSEHSCQAGVTLRHSDEERAAIVGGATLYITMHVEIEAEDVFGAPIREREVFSAIRKGPIDIGWIELERYQRIRDEAAR